jgi:hypothetical protein
MAAVVVLQAALLRTVDQVQIFRVSRLVARSVERVLATRVANLTYRVTVSRVGSFPAFCVRLVPIGAVEGHLDGFLALSTRLAALLLAAVVARFVGSAARLPTWLRFTCVHVAASLTLVAAVASPTAFKRAATRWALQTQVAGRGAWFIVAQRLRRAVRAALDLKADCVQRENFVGASVGEHCGPVDGLAASFLLHISRMLQSGEVTDHDEEMPSAAQSNADAVIFLEESQPCGSRQAQDDDVVLFALEIIHCRDANLDRVGNVLRERFSSRFKAMSCPTYGVSTVMRAGVPWTGS